MAPKISVIVCTHNRSKSILDTLQSLNEMDVPDEVNWEVLIVDNNSSDDTRIVVNKFIEDGHPYFKYIFEPNQGKTYALNHGINKAKGEMLAFTDDDAIVDKYWLKMIVETFKKYDADCVGGKVMPIWLGARPEWLTDQLLNVLAILDLGDSVYEFDWKSYDYMLFGVNFAFKKDFFLKNGLFNVKLGSIGEDQEMFGRLSAIKGKAVYHPKIIVNHKITPERLQKSYFRKWHYVRGVVWTKLNFKSRFRILGIPGYMISKLLLTLKNYLWSIITFNKHLIFFYELKLIFYFVFCKNKIKESIFVDDN